MAPIAVVMALLSGCASESFLKQPASVSPEDDIAATRAAIAELGEHRYAKDVAAELERASRWLEDASRWVADGDGEDEKTQLRLVAARTQVAEVKSYFLRREADAALEKARKGYVGERDAARELEQNNLQLEQ
jgi:hypothetical protein